MAIVRNRLKKMFTTVPNEIITDLDVTDKALRVYLYVASKPDNWEVNNADIQKSLNIKQKHTIANSWKNLIQTGWITREFIKDKNNKFTGGYNYELREKPIKSPKCGSAPLRDEPDFGSIHSVVQPHFGTNHTLNKTDSKNKTDSNKNSLSISQKKTELQKVLDEHKKKEEERKDFKQFKKRMLKNFCGMYLEKEIFLNEAGFLEKDGVSLTAKEALSVWSALYARRETLNPMSYDELKKEKELLRNDLNNKIEQIKSKTFKKILVEQQNEEIKYKVKFINRFDEETRIIELSLENVDYFADNFLLSAKIDRLIDFDTFEMIENQIHFRRHNDYEAFLKESLEKV